MFPLHFEVQKRSETFVLCQLALKHRQGRNHKMRIVVFVGSPVEEDEKEVNTKS